MYICNTNVYTYNMYNNVHVARLYICMYNNVHMYNNVYMYNIYVIIIYIYVYQCTCSALYMQKYVHIHNKTCINSHISVHFFGSV